MGPRFFRAWLLAALLSALMVGLVVWFGWAFIDMAQTVYTGE